MESSHDETHLDESQTDISTVEETTQEETALEKLQKKQNVQRKRRLWKMLRKL